MSPLLVRLHQYRCILGLVLALACGLVQPAFSYAADGQSMPLGQLDVQPVPAQYASYWVETERLLAGELPPADAWQPIDFATITAGPLAQPVWFRVPVHNATQVALKYLAEVRWLNIDAVEYFIQRDSGLERHFLGLNEQGELVTVKNSSFEFPLMLEPQEQAVLLFRVETRYFSFLPLFIWEEQAYKAQLVRVHNWYFLGFGALLALLLYNFSLSVFVRDRAYFFYCCYVVSILIYEMAFNGMGNAFVWQDNIWMHKNALGLGIYLSFLTGTLFFREFLNIGAYSIWLQRMVDISMLYWGAALLVLFTMDSFFQSSIYMSMVVCVVAVMGSGYLWYLGNPLAKFYLLAWVTLLFFTVLMLLMITGVLPHHPVTEHGQMIGFVTEMLLLSFALAARINMERDQREQAQRRALKLQLDINQERENTIDAQQQVLELEKHNNQLLEQRVQERTLELQDALGSLSAANEQLARLTVTDPLTGAANRRHFDEVLEVEIQRAVRNAQPLSLILIDIDHFKQLNDQHGHIAGDECLKSFAELLTRMVNRKTDMVARYGGEEFALVLPETSQESAFVVAEKVRLAVESMNFRFKETTIPITVSLGVVGLIPGKNFSATDFVDAADHALYSAKHSGRNRCVMAEAAS